MHVKMGKKEMRMMEKISNTVMGNTVGSQCAAGDTTTIAIAAGRYLEITMPNNIRQPTINLFDYMRADRSVLGWIRQPLNSNSTMMLNGIIWNGQAAIGVRSAEAAGLLQASILIPYLQQSVVQQSSSNLSLTIGVCDQTFSQVIGPFYLSDTDLYIYGVVFGNLADYSIKEKGRDMILAVQNFITALPPQPRGSIFVSPPAPSVAIPVGPPYKIVTIPPYYYPPYRYWRPYSRRRWHWGWP